MWDFPRSGMEPVSPALAGGFFTTEPPGKPNTGYYFHYDVKINTAPAWRSTPSLWRVRVCFIRSVFQRRAFSLLTRLFLAYWPCFLFQGTFGSQVPRRQQAHRARESAKATPSSNKGSIRASLYVWNSSTDPNFLLPVTNLNMKKIWRWT